MLVQYNCKHRLGSAIEYCPPIAIVFGSCSAHSLEQLIGRYSKVLFQLSTNVCLRYTACIIFYNHQLTRDQVL